MSVIPARPDRWWLSRYAGEDNPVEACPGCGRMIPVNPVDGCFLLHGARPADAGGPHGELCPSSGKRVPKPIEGGA